MITKGVIYEKSIDLCRVRRFPVDQKDSSKVQPILAPGSGLVHDSKSDRNLRKRIIDWFLGIQCCMTSVGVVIVDDLLSTYCDASYTSNRNHLLKWTVYH